KIYQVGQARRFPERDLRVGGQLLLIHAHGNPRVSRKLARWELRGLVRPGDLEAAGPVQPRWFKEAGLTVRPGIERLLAYANFLHLLRQGEFETLDYCGRQIEIEAPFGVFVCYCEFHVERSLMHACFVDNDSESLISLFETA